MFLDNNIGTQDPPPLTTDSNSHIHLNHLNLFLSKQTIQRAIDSQSIVSRKSAVCKRFITWQLNPLDRVKLQDSNNWRRVDVVPHSFAARDVGAKLEHLWMKYKLTIVWCSMYPTIRSSLNWSKKCYQCNWIKCPVANIISTMTLRRYYWYFYWVIGNIVHCKS